MNNYSNLQATMQNSSGLWIFFGISPFWLQQSFLYDSKRAILLHPLCFDGLREHFLQIIHYEIGAEEGVLALMLYALQSLGPQSLQAFIDELDIGYLAAESNFSEEEIDKLAKHFAQFQRHYFCIGHDILCHPRLSALQGLIKAMHQIPSFEFPLLDAPNLPLDNLCSEIILDESNGLFVYIDTSSKEPMLQVSSQFLIAARKKEGLVCIELAQTKEKIQVLLRLNAELKGMLGVLTQASRQGPCYQKISFIK